jgi:hypothetical protein
MTFGFFSKDDPRETGISNPGLLIPARICASSPSLTSLDGSRKKRSGENKKFLSPILLVAQDESEREVRENSQRI